MAPEPWSAERVPPETVAAVRAMIGPLVEGIIEAVRAENRVYAEVLEAPEGVGIRIGVEQAIKAFLDAVEQGEKPATETADVWRALGEAEFQAGRSLEALRAAWRTGTRAAWRGAAELAAAAGVPAPTVISLAEAIFVYTDELGSDVVEGYLRMQSDAAGERERRRRRLASLLLDPEQPDPEAIDRAAALARWPVPRSAAVLVLGSDSAGAVVRRLGIDVLVGSDASGAWLVVPDPSGPGRAAELRRAVGSIPAALGPAVAPRQLARSLQWARRVLELVGCGALPSERPTRAENHLATLALLWNAEVASALADQQLRTLDALAAGERERLLETLAAWLAHQRQTPAVAAALHVHPQTVRYRTRRLRELLGNALDAPEGRFELELALRVRRALTA